MWKQQFQVGDRQVRCVPEAQHGVKAGLKIAQCVELPAKTEVIVPCFTHASHMLLVACKEMLLLPNLVPTNGDIQKMG